MMAQKKFRKLGRRWLSMETRNDKTQQAVHFKHIRAPIIQCKNIEWMCWNHTEVQTK